MSPSSDSDFVQDDSEADEDIPTATNGRYKDTSWATPASRRRAAACSARSKIRSSFVGNQSSLVLNVPNLPLSLSTDMEVPPPEPKTVPLYMTRIISPEIMGAARIFSSRQPILLTPPVLSANRLRVDASSIYLYAADGCCSMQEMWASALSSTRFGGPRRHAPFRELHRLSDPSPLDSSDWAENIRWAKEQQRAFGSDTWTEYDNHLEIITEARRATLWVSEETVRAGM